jgi:hypothetical protein
MPVALLLALFLGLAAAIALIINFLLRRGRRAR